MQTFRGTSPSPPAQPLSFPPSSAGVEGWGEELLPVTSALFPVTFTLLTASNPKLQTPLITTDWLESQREFFSLPHPTELFSPNLCCECISSPSVFSTAWELYTTHNTSYRRIIAGLHTARIDEGHVYFCILFFFLKT